MADHEAHVRSRLPDSLRVLVTVLRNPRLRRIQLAFTAFNVMEWATWIAIIVYAYGRGGPLEAGAASLFQLAPSAIVAPIAAVLGDRFPRALVLRIGYVAQGAAAIATGAALVAGLPSPLVYVLGMVTATVITLTRPVQAALLPELASTAEELTASNVASSTIENLGVFAGPALAAVLLTVSGPGSVFVTCGLLLLVAAALLPKPRPEERDPYRIPLRNAIARELSAGPRALRHSPPTRSVVMVLAVGYLLLGALDVFFVVLALDVLGFDDGVAGVLNGAVGAGGLLGAALAVGLVGRSSMTRWFQVGALVFGASMALAGLGPALLAGSAGGAAVPAALAGVGLASVVLALGAAGAGRSIADVAGWTLLQRVTPSQTLTRVFGVLEAMNAGLQGVGGAIAAILVATLGPVGALAVAGATLPIVAFVQGGALRRFEASSVVDQDRLAVLRQVPMLSPLTPPVLERLAADAVPVRAPEGSAIIVEGEVGDRFYVIESGRVEARVGERAVRVQGPGDGFGEIALLRDIPRTASVVALEDTNLLAIERPAFLEAIVGRAPSRVLAEQVVEERLAGT